jgi:O-antigen/teichoic acid export membrane protein
MPGSHCGATANARFDGNSHLIWVRCGKKAPLRLVHQILLECLPGAARKPRKDRHMAVADTDGETAAERGPVRALAARLAAGLASWRRDGSDRSVAQRIAGAAFLIRVASAAIIYVSQVLLARWMGRFEFGIYVYVWAWVGFLGMLSPLGVAYSAQRFIPEYRTREDHDGLRGFLAGSRWLCLALGTGAGAALAGIVWLAAARIAPYYFWPFMIAAAVLPIFAVSSAQDSIARAFNRIDLALVPGYVVHPLMIIAAMAALHLAGVGVRAVAALGAACLAFWIVVLAQGALLGRTLARDVGRGTHRYDVATWIRTSLPIFLVDSFFILLTYVDILVLQAFVGPAEVAVYYAATKTLVMISFVYFAVGAASAHRFSQYHVAGERAKLERFVADTIRWTFWPSLALAAGLLIVGKPLLALFGPGFAEGYPLIFVLVIGLIARSSVGPSERLLNMVGEQRVCAAIYAAAFATNLALCLVLIPRFGLIGAAASTASAILVESTLLFIVTKRRLGLHIFVFGK